MYLEDLPRTLPAHGQDLMLRVQLIKALDYLARKGTTEDKQRFSLALQAARLYANDGAEPAAVALAAATRVIVKSATELDLIFPSTVTFHPDRPILATQFVVTTGTVTSVTRVAPNVLRITGTGLGVGDTTAFTNSGVEATRLRYADFVAAGNQAAVGAAAAPTLTGLGATVVSNGSTGCTITLPYRNTGRPAFGAFSVATATVTGVSYPDDNRIVLTGTGFGAGDVVTYTDPGSGQRLNAVTAWAEYLVQTGAAPAMS
jgi:hypothetical protein